MATESPSKILRKFKKPADADKDADKDNDKTTEKGVKRNALLSFIAKNKKV